MDSEEILFDAEDRMEKALSILRAELRTMRTGRAHPGLVETIRVDYYGSPTPLKQIASISAPESDLLVIKAFDRSALKDIEKAILKSEIGINPANDGKLIRLKIPALSGERRKQLVARAREVGEEARVSMRNIRRDANRQTDQIQKKGELGEDDLHRLKDEIQQLTKKMEETIDKDLEAKTKDLMEM